MLPSSLCCYASRGARGEFISGLVLTRPSYPEILVQVIRAFADVFKGLVRYLFWEPAGYGQELKTTFYVPALSFPPCLADGISLLLAVALTPGASRGFSLCHLPRCRGARIPNLCLHSLLFMWVQGT